MVAAIVCYDYKDPFFFFVNDPENNKMLNLDKDVYINNLLLFWFDDLRNKGMIQGNKLVNGYWTTAYGICLNAGHSIM